MARNRIVVDVITEEPLSEIRLRAMAREAADQIYAVVVEQEDGVIENAEKNMHGHVHVSTPRVNCEFCIENGTSDRLH